MKVLVACEFSGIVSQAFRDKGHDAISCDLLENELTGRQFHYKGDVRDILHEDWDLIIGHPPCTYLAVSGNGPHSKKLDKIKEAADFFMLLYNAPCNKVCIENPVGRMSTIFRKPDQYIQPWMFGHGETKKTGLWLKNLPLLKPSNIVEGREGKILKYPPSKDRWKLRSITYPGIAKAMADQWG